MASSGNTTQDHDFIREWADKRGAKPAEVASTEQDGHPGILRLEFPGAPNANDDALKEISWEDFFEKFDESGLEFLYQEETAGGEQSNFNKLIYPDPESSEGKSLLRKTARKKTAGKAASKGATRSSSRGSSKTVAAPAKKGAKSATSTKGAGKTSAKKAAAKTVATKAGKTTKTSTVSRSTGTTRKTAAGKPTTAKTTAGKTSAKKTASKKVAAKKTVAKKAPAKKVAAKKLPAKTVKKVAKKTRR